MKIEITYVDGDRVEGPPETWPFWRADGVNRVTVDGRKFEGHSLYWLYRELGAWVAGCGSMHRLDPFEVIFRDDGPVEDRPLRSFPDVRHKDVKLGWWYPMNPRDL